MGNALTTGWIRNRAKTAHYQISEHVIRFLMAGKISLREIEDSVLSGKIIEIHQNPKRSQSALVLGYSEEKPVHVMCAAGKNGWLVVLFAYIPGPPVWADPTHRKKKRGKSMDEASSNCFFCGGGVKGITFASFDYRLEGQLYVIKNVPAGLCQQCGEKYITAAAAKKIDRLIDAGNYSGTEEIRVLEYY